MYYITKNNIINMNRGDFLRLPIKLFVGKFPFDKQFIPDDGDYVYFGMMNSGEPFERSFLKKEFTKDNFDDEGNLILEIYPEDTMNILPGTYFYEIKILYYLEDEDPKIEHIDTVVQKTKINIID